MSNTASNNTIIGNNAVLGNLVTRQINGVEKRREMVVEYIIPDAVNGVSPLTVSADFWFVNPETGKYEFNPSEISHAHGACMAAYIRALEFKNLDGITAPKVVILRGIPGAGKSTFIQNEVRPGGMLADVDIVVDNTAISVAEIAPYLLVAQAHGGEGRIITLRCDPAKAAARNTHGVPPHAVERMAAALDAEAARFAPWWTHTVIDGDRKY